jgi:hypothetical protein
VEYLGVVAAIVKYTRAVDLGRNILLYLLLERVVRTSRQGLGFTSNCVCHFDSFISYHIRWVVISIVSS